MEENAKRGGKVVGIVITIIVILAALAGGWYWFKYKPEQEAKEKARLEQIAKEEARKKREEQAAKRKAKYEELITIADGQFSEENWEAAQSNYREASSLMPKQQYPKDQLAIINETLEALAAEEAKVGTVQTISSATGRYYVIVSSSIDDDLAVDFGNKLAEEGNAVTILEPIGKKPYYRLSLANYETLEEAVSASSSFQSSDGEPVWVLKY